MKEALYEIASMRRFAGFSLGSGSIPDETTILNFRHLLEANKLTEHIFALINQYLLSKGLRLSRNTIVDTTIIEAPSSTKNATGTRDPEMHQTKKGNNWHFGMKAHIGVDAETGLKHSLQTTIANVHDLNACRRTSHRRRERHLCRCWLPWGREAHPDQSHLAHCHAAWKATRTD